METCSVKIWERSCWKTVEDHNKLQCQNCWRRPAGDNSDTDYEVSLTQHCPAEGRADWPWWENINQRLNQKFVNSWFWKNSSSQENGFNLQCP